MIPVVAGVNANREKENLAWVDQDKTELESRQLTSMAEHEIQLFFDLQYVRSDVANLIDIAERSQPIVSQICTSVEQQVCIE